MASVIYMSKQNRKKYYCSYYNVGYFVFVESVHTGVIEPIIEVDSKESGEKLIGWLKENKFVTKQIINVSNDNF
ncbi:MAG: hypothetical protein R3D71_10210 [Rickettsiales bacterium]